MTAVRPIVEQPRHAARTEFIIRVEQQLRNPTQIQLLCVTARGHDRGRMSIAQHVFQPLGCLDIFSPYCGL
jgi:hypothetical protein